jgi:filamentous hemagglutinin family protein
VGGQISIGSPTDNSLTITQSSQRGAINWQTFNIGTGNTVQFVQPNSNSITLNRVVGGVPSNIQGALLANGQVWIQNANGVLFGNGATINVNSLLVTTKNVDVNQFMAGNAFDLASTGGNAGIINDGSITAAGYITLIGDQVRNSGSISAKQMVLAAGDSATVALDNGQGISVTLTNSTANALVENSGRIVAGNDGSVLLTAQGKDTLLDTVINLSGVVKAGTIVADAGITGDVVVTGDLDASNQNGKGGAVVLSGNRVGLFDDATVNVSGDASGGLAIIGGDNLNKVPGSSASNLINEVTFADYTQIDSGVKIDAGSANGDGGFIESSGAVLSVDGTISAAAPNGKSGLWLIDPTNITISGGVSGAPTGGTFTGGAFAGTAATATITNQTISDTLNTSTNVLITTASSQAGAGNITQSVGADINTTGTATLTLEAAATITLNGNIAEVGAGKLNLNLTADAEHFGNGAVTQCATSTIDLNGGKLTMSGNVTTLSGGIVNGVLINGNITNIGTGTITGHSNAGAGVSFISSSTLTLNGDNDVTIIGTTNTGTNVAVAVGVNMNGTLFMSDNSKLMVIGESNTGRAVTISNTTLSGHANLTLNGTSRDDAGVVKLVTSSNFIVTDDATATFTGEGGLVGVGINHDVDVSGNGTIVVVGRSVESTGTSTGGFNVSDNGVVTITGTSTNGTGALLGGAAGFVSTNVSGNGSVTVTGTSTNGVGVETATSGNPLTISDNGTLNINGTSTTNTGVNLRNNMSSDGGGSSVNVIGNSTSGAGVSMGQRVDATTGATTDGETTATNNGTISIAGNSQAGTGIDLQTTFINLTSPYNGTVTTANITAETGGTVTLTGNSNGSGVGVNMPSGSVVTTNGTGSTTAITGLSKTNTGVVFNGTTETTDGGDLTVFGNASAFAVGLVFGNGSVVNTSNAATSIYGFDTSGSHDLGVPASNSTTNNGTLTLCRNDFVCGRSLPGNGSVATGGGGGDGGGGSDVGAVAGVAVLGGLIAFLAGGEGEVWALQAPQALSGEGFVPLWCNAMLDYVEISGDQKQAFVRLHTQEGLIERTLPLKDGGNGVRHYGAVDGTTGEYAELSFNPETREYFFQESGTRGGAAYAVKSHGWLGKKEDVTDPTKGDYELSDAGCAVAPPVVEAPVPVPEPAWKTVLTEKPVRIDGANFATDSAKLLPGAEDRLSAVLQAAMAHPEINLSVAGHTDSTGSRAWNEALSGQRAEAVKAWLVGRGIAAERISSAGFADTQPAESNATREGRAANRRVEVSYTVREETRVRVE